MLCENCQERFATVHLSGWRTAADPVQDGERRPHFDRHFCEQCLHKLEQRDPLLNPLLATPDARRIKLRVVGASPDQTRLVEITPDSPTGSRERVFLTSRLPSQYREVGMEFEVFCNHTQEAWLEGKE